MKTAIVTGGTKGIGLAITSLLLNKGYYVYATFATDTENANKARKSFENLSNNFSIIKVDQSDKKAITFFTETILKERNQIDCIICNAGTTIRKSAKDISDKEWETVMQVCLNSHFYIIRNLWNIISNGARIVFIGSLMGIQPHASSLAYGVAKAAVHSLAKNLVKEFENTKTTVNVVAPGFVETEWQKNKSQQIKDNICAKTALHRFATPEEVANAVNFCIENPFVNGSIIELTGGYCYK